VDSESKSWTTAGSIYEALDENIINKNNFCIIIGAFVRKNAISPKTVNLQEYQMLLNSYKAMFNYLSSTRQNSKEGESLITKAFDQKGNISSDIVNFKEEVNQPAVAQHLGMLTHLRAWSFIRANAYHKSVKTLWIDEKDAGSKLMTHPTSTFNTKQDELSKNDAIYQKCQQSHPQYYFNNLGLVHLKMKKYHMAILYLSKAIKFLEKSNDKTYNHPPQKT
jgi:tetratricopeptide (TPR) repeat protein|tara:strand:- start:1474 stop:2136 length:663 start_codon:yes stop_codon:yes gene_type:complete